VLADEPFAPGQIQPASIDLRLGPVAYRVRASFLPGPAATVEEKLRTVFMHEVDLRDGAVLEAGCVYIVPLLERAEFSARISGGANPKSSTGRIDVFTRLITDYAPSFDRIEPGYRGPRLCRDLSPDLSGAGAQGFAPQPAAHPPRLAPVHRHTIAPPARTVAAGRGRARHRQRAGAVHRPERQCRLCFPKWGQAHRFPRQESIPA